MPSEYPSDFYSFRTICHNFTNKMGTQKIAPHHRPFLDPPLIIVAFLWVFKGLYYHPPWFAMEAAIKKMPKIRPLMQTIMCYNLTIGLLYFGY